MYDRNGREAATTGSGRKQKGRFGASHARKRTPGRKLHSGWRRWVRMSLPTWAEIV
jgi:hypothetical protein